MSIKIILPSITQKIKIKSLLSREEAERILLDEINEEIVSLIEKKRSINLSEQPYMKEKGWGGVIYPFISAYR